MKKFLSAIIVLMIVFGLTGCGGGGGGGSNSGGGVSDDPIGDSSGGGNSENVQAFNKLKEYHAMFDASAYFITVLMYERTYHPITAANKTDFVNNLISNKKFTETYSEANYFEYQNTPASPLPSSVLEAYSTVQYEEAYGTYGYTITNSMFAHNNTLSNDALYNSVFGTVNGNLAREGFSVEYAVNTTLSTMESDFDALIDIIKAPPHNFACSGDIHDIGDIYRCTKSEGNYQYIFEFNISNGPQHTFGLIMMLYQQQ
ncbi:MAG: hypothetical protein LBL65_02845 [Campylobacteraceae bacterium]|jgi:hypothetical protein|nr:hypothetical protein [Campylobacteraceae bacterium]